MGRVACKVKMREREEESPHPPRLSGFKNPVWVARLWWPLGQEKVEVSGFLILRIIHPSGKEQPCPFMFEWEEPRGHILLFQGPLPSIQMSTLVEDEDT